MKRVNFKKNVLAVAVVMATGYMGSTAAHEIPSAGVSEPLGSGLNAYDVYHTTCYSDTLLIDPESNSAGAATGLRAGVSMISRTGAGATPKVTIGANRLVGAVHTQSQASCTDTTVTAGGYTYPTNYCGGTDGTQAYLGKGNGDYVIVVNHESTTTGTINYNVITHCENTALPLGARHTGTGAHLTYSAGATIVNGVVTGTVNTLPTPYIKEINY